MPIVNGKHFPYTKAGKEAAKVAEKEADMDKEMKEMKRRHKKKKMTSDGMMMV